MERSRPTTQTERSRELPGRSGRLDVASRRAALEIAQIDRPPVQSAGPILITGESGAGKTRLWSRLADEASLQLAVRRRPGRAGARPRRLPRPDGRAAWRRTLGSARDQPPGDRLRPSRTNRPTAGPGCWWSKTSTRRPPEVWTEIEALSAGEAQGPKRGSPWSSWSVGLSWRGDWRADRSRPWRAAWLAMSICRRSTSMKRPSFWPRSIPIARRPPRSSRCIATPLETLGRCCGWRSTEGSAAPSRRPPRPPPGSSRLLRPRSHPRVLSRRTGRRPGPTPSRCPPRPRLETPPLVPSRPPFARKKG